MTWYTFETTAVYDAVTDTVKENATGGKLVTVKDGPAIPIRDLNANSLTQITSNPSGQAIQFQAEVPGGLMQFGDVCVAVWAREVGQMVQSVDEAIAAAQSAASSAASAAAVAQNALVQLQAYIDANPGTGGGLTTENVQDIVGAMTVAGAGAGVVYNDAAGTITITGTGGTGTGLDAETARDTIAAALVAAGYVSVTVNDAADTITIGNTTALDTALVSKVANSLYDANTILAATTDNTPAPLTVGPSTLVGRAATGGIAALTPAQVQTLLRVTSEFAAAVYDQLLIVPSGTFAPEAIAGLNEYVLARASGGGVQSNIYGGDENDLGPV